MHWHLASGLLSGMGEPERTQTPLATWGTQCLREGTERHLALAISRCGHPLLYVALKAYMNGPEHQHQTDREPQQHYTRDGVATSTGNQQSGHPWLYCGTQCLREGTGVASCMGHPMWTCLARCEASERKRTSVAITWHSVSARWDRVAACTGDLLWACSPGNKSQGRSGQP